MARIESDPHKQSYGQRHHVKSCEGAKNCDDWENKTLSYNQGNRILGACIVVTSLLNMGNGSKSLMRMLIGEINSAIDEHEISGGKVKTSNGIQPHFICATNKCKGGLTETAMARVGRDPDFKPTVCSECHFKGTRTDNIAVPIVMQVSTDEPEHKAQAVKKMRKGTRRVNAELDQRPALAERNVKFTMTVNTNDSAAGVSGVMPTLSAYFEAIVPDVDEPSQSDEEGGDTEGDRAGEDENEDASSGESDGSACRASHGDGDDDQSDEQPYYKYEDYKDAIGRIRTHLSTLLGEGALSEIVALLDGFEAELDKREGDSPCTIFDNIATALLERGDSDGAEMAMREGIDTRREGDNFDCYSALAHLLAAKGDVAEAARILQEGAAIEDKEGDGGDNCIEYLDEIEERYGVPSSLDPGVLLVEGASESPSSTSTSGDDNEHLINKTVGSGTGYDEEAVQRDEVSVAAAEQADADALLKWCEKPKRRGVASVWRPDEDSLLAAGVDTFSTGEAHRWRSIAEMVPEKNAAQCQSRARDEDFIQAHRDSGGKKGQPSSVFSPGGAVFMVRTSGKVTWLYGDAGGGGTASREGTSRTA